MVRQTRSTGARGTSQPLMLLILDGFGIRKQKFGNAIAAAGMPYYHSLLKQWPHAVLQASGEGVGLPKGFQGNSEVGHLILGAGRIVYQMLMRINRSIADKHFFRNPELLKAIAHCKRTGGALHLLGLVQDQGVHAHQDHLFALLKLCKQHQLDRVFIHFFADGRDTPPKSALKFLTKLEQRIRTLRIGEIATISGRYYAMDRDQRWERTRKAYETIALANGPRTKTARAAIQQAYAKGTTDEFIPPTVIGTYSGMGPRDAAAFWNFRLDRARQLSHALADSTFRKFPRPRRPAHFTPLCQYYAGLRNVAFPEVKLTRILGEELARAGKRQLRIAETEKYAHVTYFFNGQQERPFRGEARLLVQSPKHVPTYDQAPEMGAPEITAQALRAIGTGKHGVIILNFANPDMVGHTGDFKATVTALGVIDNCLAAIIPTILARGGVVCLTADHGNCEEKIAARTKGPLTAHTRNPVPFILIGTTEKLRQKGTLADVAPTVLALLGIAKPKEMTGKSLLSSRY